MKGLVRGLAVVMLLAAGWMARGVLSLARASAATGPGVTAPSPPPTLLRCCLRPVANIGQLAGLLGQGRTLFYRPGPAGPWVPFTVGARYVGPGFVWLSSGQVGVHDG